MRETLKAQAFTRIRAVYLSGRELFEVVTRDGFTWSIVARFGTRNEADRCARALQPKPILIRR